MSAIVAAAANAAESTVNDVDPYPTRVSAPAVFPRQEPILWHKHQQGHVANANLRKSGDRQQRVSAQLLADFERDGYVFLPGVFSGDEVAELRAELERLKAHCARHKPEEAFFERGTDALRSLFFVQKYSQRFAEVARDPRLLDPVEAILDDDVYLHQSRVNYKPAYTGKEFFWHSDFETWHAEDGMPRMRAVSASIVLTSNSPLNGPLMLIPGSHRYFVSCIGETPQDHYRHSLVRQELGTPDHETLNWLVEQGGVDMPTGPEGSVLLFDCNVMHASNSNVSPYPRSNLFFVYNAVSNASVEPFAAQAPRPPFVGAREVVPLRVSGSESAPAQRGR